MSDPTFRDFAAAIMGQDLPAAGAVLATLLGVDADAGIGAATHFQRKMSGDPSFVAKAMGLRTAVTSGSDDNIAALLVDCFDLPKETVAEAVRALRRRYPATS